MPASFERHVYNSFKNYGIKRLIPFVSGGRKVNFISVDTFISHRGTYVKNRLIFFIQREREREKENTDQGEKAMQCLNPIIYQVSY